MTLTPETPASNWADWARTIGSLSTYTTRQLASTDRTTSWVLPDGRQPGADVDELPDAAPGDPPGRPLMESAVRPGTVLDLRHQRHDARGRVAVGLEVALAA